MKLAKSYSREEQAESCRLHVLIVGQIMNAMNNLGMSQADLARATGYSRGYVSQVLNGDRTNMCLNSVVRFGNAVGVQWHIEDGGYE